jgi:hypothetical protein
MPDQTTVDVFTAAARPVPVQVIKTATNPTIAVDSKDGPKAYQLNCTLVRFAWVYPDGTSGTVSADMFDVTIKPGYPVAVGDRMEHAEDGLYANGEKVPTDMIGLWGGVIRPADWYDDLTPAPGEGDRP